MSRSVPHFNNVDLPAVKAEFFDDRRHRASLFLPFAGRSGSRTLCVIGQNPSAADEKNADKTIRYLEEFIYRLRPEYGALLMLNLYSRVDTTKSATTELLHSRCADIFNTSISAHDDFLLVYGKLTVEGAYKFPERALAVTNQLKSKNVLKFRLDSHYPPHPGNPRILYRNFDIPLVRV